jgi:hypothetical protein
MEGFSFCRRSRKFETIACTVPDSTGLWVPSPDMSFLFRVQLYVIGMLISRDASTTQVFSRCL